MRQIGRSDIGSDHQRVDQTVRTVRGNCAVRKCGNATVFEGKHLILAFVQQVIISERKVEIVLKQVAKIGWPKLCYDPPN